MSLKEFITGKLGIDKLLAFVFGVVFLLTMLVITLIIPDPTGNQRNVFRLMLALSAAGVAALIPGFLNVRLSAGKKLAVRAAGALAVFVIVLLVSPG